MRFFWIIFGVIALDQTTKVIVRLNMAIAPRRSIPLIGDWLKFTFAENDGMAFGISFGPALLIPILSIVATALIVFYLIRVKNVYWPYSVCLATILGGAIGNIIDRLFYGMFFGYGGFFGGRVVDFIHFDIWRGFLPDALPGIGGSYMAFFPIFNVADIAIVGGVAGILLFQKRFHLRQAEGELSVGEAAPMAQEDVVGSDPVESDAPAEA